MPRVVLGYLFALLEANSRRLDGLQSGKTLGVSPIAHPSLHFPGKVVRAFCRLVSFRCGMNTRKLLVPSTGPGSLEYVQWGRGHRGPSSMRLMVNGDN